MSNVLLTLLVLLVLIVLGVLVVVSLQLRRSGAGEQAVISERLSQLGPVTRTVNDIRVDLASLQADLRVH